MSGVTASAMARAGLADVAATHLGPGLILRLGYGGAKTWLVRHYLKRVRNFSLPENARFRQIHEGHLVYMQPEERRFVTPALIRATTITGSEAEIKDAIAGFAEAGYSEVAIQIVPGQEHAIEDWGHIRRAFA